MAFHNKIGSKGKNMAFHKKNGFKGENIWREYICYVM